jgi:hypothetical protein
MEDSLELKSSQIDHCCFCSFLIFIANHTASALQMKMFYYSLLHLNVFDRSKGSSVSLNIMKNHPNSFKLINSSKFIMLFHSLFS